MQLGIPSCRGTPRRCFHESSGLNYGSCYIVAKKYRTAEARPAIHVSSPDQSTVNLRVEHTCLRPSLQLGRKRQTMGGYPHSLVAKLSGEYLGLSYVLWSRRERGGCAIESVGNWMLVQKLEGKLWKSDSRSGETHGRGAAMMCCLRRQRKSPIHCGDHNQKAPAPRSTEWFLGS